MRNERVVLIVGATILWVAIIGCQTFPKKTEMQTVIMEEGIVYSTVDGVDLKLDLARPGTGKGPYPALVIIHGAWLDSPSYRQSTAREAELAAERGYVAVNVDYLFAYQSEGTKPEYPPFPAPLHDVKCAVRWLRSNAEKYDIDPARIGALGYTLGGYLALLLGLTDSSDGLEGVCRNLNFSSEVQAVVNVEGFTDLVSYFETSSRATYFLVQLVGGTLEEMPEAYRLASPVSYVSEGDPPVLTVHAKQKYVIPPWVPPQQAELLDKKMKEMGFSHTLIWLEDDSDYFEIEADYPVWDFFDKHLKGRH